MARRRSGGKSSKKVHVPDMSKVEARGKGDYPAIPDGVYPVTITAATLEEGPSAPYIKAELTVSEGKYDTRKVWTNLSLAPNALFNLRGLLEALEMDIPDGGFDIELEELVGLDLDVELVASEYKGKPKNDVVAYINPNDSDEEDDEDEEDGEIGELLEELSKAELIEIGIELGEKKVSLAKKKASSIVQILMDGYDEEEIQDAYDEVIGEEEEDEEEEDESYDDMTLSELKSEARERGLRITKGLTKDDLIEMLEEDDG